MDFVAPAPARPSDELALEIFGETDHLAIAMLGRRTSVDMGEILKSLAPPLARENEYRYQVWYHVSYDPQPILYGSFGSIADANTKARRLAYEPESEMIIFETQFFLRYWTTLRNGTRIHIAEGTAGDNIATWVMRGVLSATSGLSCLLSEWAAAHTRQLWATYMMRKVVPPPDPEDGVDGWELGIITLGRFPSQSKANQAAGQARLIHLAAQPNFDLHRQHQANAWLRNQLASLDARGLCFQDTLRFESMWVLVWSEPMRLPGTASTPREDGQVVATNG